MKKMIQNLLILFSIFLGVFFSFSFCWAETINGFNSIININTDATVDISETIDYDFGNLEKHGFYRDIPINYFGSSNYSIIIDNVSVKDENGKVYSFSKSYDNKNIKFKIGDANVLISGIKTYEIKYNTFGAISHFANYDEFYWNVNGFDWTVPILKSKATVFLPLEAKDDSIFEIKCFYGSYGSKSECDYNFETKEDHIEVNFVTPRILNAGENLTIAIKFPKGIVSQSTTRKVNIYQLIINFFDFNNLDLDVAILFVLAFVFIWFKFGKEPRGRGVIIPQYDVPDGLTPIQVGTIADQVTDGVDISAQIIYLAINGYLRISKLEKEDYKLEKLKDDNSLVNLFDKNLMGYLFNQGNEVNLSDIKKRKDVFLTQKYIADIKKDVISDLESKEYFKKNGTKAKMIVLLVFGALIAINYHLFIGIISFIVSLILITLVGYVFSVRAKKGVEAKEYINGLKLYLSVAEKRRIDFHNDPKKNPKIFEKFLPYAMVLGIEKKWASQFDSIYLSNWYHSSSPVSFVLADNFIHDIAAFSTATNSAFAFSTSGSGSSAFGGGGGFSGGGGGGGGGGSW